MKNNIFQNKKICVIGYGQFGQFLCNVLLANQEILVYSSRKHKKIRNLSFNNNISETVKDADIIFPAVPISEFEKNILAIKPFLKPGATIIDICSVMNYPVMIMNKYLEKNIFQIATHPMFGPSSYEQRGYSLNGLVMVMFNISAAKEYYKNIKKYFASLGLTIIEMEPEEHDRLEANSQFFAHMLKYTASQLSINRTTIDTPAVDQIQNAFECMGKDKNLLQNLLRYNIYCREVLKKSVKTLSELQKTYI